MSADYIQFLVIAELRLASDGVYFSWAVSNTNNCVGEK